MAEGGSFRSNPYRTGEDGSESRWMAVWGEVIDDPKTVTFKKTKVSCTVKIHSKVFQIVVAWEDADCFTALQAVEKGDTILVFGTQTIKPYTTKKGERKSYHDLTASIVIPQQAVNLAIITATNPNIAKIMEADYDPESDALESKDDHTESEEDEYVEVSDDDDGGFFASPDDVAEEVPFA